MARSRKVEARTGDEHADVIAWYRDRLSEPAALPWAGSQWAPVLVGPTWKTTPDGHWLLPDATLGWDVLGWCGTELQHGRGKPWRFTLEQARFVLWWYSLNERGEFNHPDGSFQRLKGHGKDPLGGCLIYTELIGPCRFAGWDGDTPIATDNPEAWVQTAATSLEQTKNTMRLMPGLITAEAKAYYGVQVGKEMIHALNGERFAQAVTSSPATLEGARATFVLKNETHHWLENNDGHEMAAVIERNATKSADGAARTLAITNAPEPGEDSEAERTWDAYEAMRAGRTVDTGLLVDSLEAPPEAPLMADRVEGESDDDWTRRTVDLIGSVVRVVRGDSVWLKPERIVKSVLDPRNPPSRSRRFWYNQRVAAEDAWLDPQAVDMAAVDDGRRDEPMVMFFDGSKSDDATALVGCRLSDGHLLTLGVWQKPSGGAGEAWTVNRGEVDAAVRAILDEGLVRAFYADPAHAKDDDETGWWDSIIDGWHRDYGAKLGHWATKSGDARHSIMWDMSSPARLAQFTTAAETFVAELEQRDDFGRLMPAGFTHDGHPAMKSHLKNARRAPNRFGVSLSKEHRESPRKIDLAVCAVGARMLRRVVLNAPQEKPRTGVVYV